MPPLGEPTFFVVKDLKALHKSWQLAILKEMSTRRLGMTLQVRPRRMNTDENTSSRQNSKERIEQGTPEKMDANDQIPRARRERIGFKVDAPRCDRDTGLGHASYGKLKSDFRYIGDANIKTAVSQPDRIPAGSSGDIDRAA